MIDQMARISERGRSFEECYVRSSVTGHIILRESYGVIFASV